MRMTYSYATAMLTQKETRLSHPALQYMQVKC